MQEELKLIVGIIILGLAYPIGDILKKYTEDEQKEGKLWFVLLTFIFLILGIIGIVLGKDWLMFTSFFITIVSSRSLKRV